jgi:hypothetical protein
VVRSFLRATGLFVAAALIAAPSAMATFHETRVTEVLTSNGGSSAQQFVELQDPAEPFPAGSGPYWLVVYSAAGAPLGSEQLSNTTLATAAAQGPMLISTAAYDAAAGTTGTFGLSVSLPIPAGQACFAHGAGKEVVHCISWGTIETQAPNSLAPPTAGAAPSDGMSLQTQCNGTAAVAAPTPGAANATVVACGGSPSPPPSSPGGTPGAGKGGEGVGKAPPSAGGANQPAATIQGRRARVSTAGTVRFTVVCPGQASSPCTGTLTLRDGSRRVGSKPFSVAAGGSRPVTLKLKRGERTKLQRRDTLSLTLEIDGTGAAPRSVRVTLEAPASSG